jgi:hypothetical protein
LKFDTVNQKSLYIWKRGDRGDNLFILIENRIPASPMQAPLNVIEMRNGLNLPFSRCDKMAARLSLETRKPKP